MHMCTHSCAAYVTPMQWYTTHKTQVRLLVAHLTPLIGDQLVPLDQPVEEHCVV